MEREIAVGVASVFYHTAKTRVNGFWPHSDPGSLQSDDSIVVVGDETIPDDDGCILPLHDPTAIFGGYVV